MEVVASLSQGRTAAAQCGLFTHKSVPVIFEPPFSFIWLLMCSTHFTLSCRILLFSLTTTNNFFKFVYSEITGEPAWWFLFRLPSLAIEGHQNLTHFDSGLLISRTFLPHAGSSCTLLCLYLVSCTQKIH